MDINSSRKVVFLGGTNSGKSRLAEEALAKRYSRLSYIATAPREWISTDVDFQAKVREHQIRRTAIWELTELTSPEELYEMLANARLPTLVDSMGTWIASRIGFLPNLDLLESSIRSSLVPLVFVSEEVGLSVIPTNIVSRDFTEILGLVNQRISNCVDRVFFVAAGRVIEMDSSEVDL